MSDHFDDADTFDDGDVRPRRKRRKDDSDWGDKFVHGEKPQPPERTAFRCPECGHVWNPRRATLQSASVRCPMCRKTLAVVEGQAVPLTTPGQPAADKPSKAKTCLGCVTIIVIGSVVAACAGS